MPSMGFDRLLGLLSGSVRFRRGLGMLGWRQWIHAQVHHLRKPLRSGGVRCVLAWRAHGGLSLSLQLVVIGGRRDPVSFPV